MCIRLLLSVGIMVLCFGCGPKDIGNSAPEEESSRTSVSSAEQMRYPMYGSGSIQQMLYLNNRMETMTVLQNSIAPVKPSPIKQPTLGKIIQ